MKRSRFTADRIIGILKEHEAGVSVADRHGIWHVLAQFARTEVMTDRPSGQGIEPHDLVTAAQDVSSRGAKGLTGPRLAPYPSIKSRGARGERFDVVMIGQRDRGLQRAIGHLSQGAGVPSRRRNRSFGAGGASSTATNAANCAASSRNACRSIRASSAACLLASIMNSDRFLPRLAAARSIKSRSRGVTRRLISDQRWVSSWGVTDKRLTIQPAARLDDTAPGLKVTESFQTPVRAGPPSTRRGKVR